MKVVPPMVNTKFCSLAKFALEILSRPVALSSVAPVALWYFWNASVASRRSVVPVSTMPAEPERSVVSVPYETSWSMPQYADAGEVDVDLDASGVSGVSGVLGACACACACNDDDACELEDADADASPNAEIR